MIADISEEIDFENFLTSKRSETFNMEVKNPDSGTKNSKYPLQSEL